MLEVVVVHRTTVKELLQSVASGLLGDAAFKGGVAAVALGLVLHFGIALGRAALFAVVARYLWPLTAWGVTVVGLGYGAVVWLLMNFVVVAFSRTEGVPVSDWGNMRHSREPGCHFLP
jgi:hypothetical protein